MASAIPRLITSTQNPLIKELYRLRVGRRRARERKGLVLVRGGKLISSLGEFFKFRHVFTHEAGETFKSYNAEEVVPVEKSLLKHVLFSQNFQAEKRSRKLYDNEYVVGTIERPAQANLASKLLDGGGSGLLTPPRRLLALDSVKHPENMGLLLSTAVALRFDGVFLAGSCIDPFSHKVLEASQAVAWTLPYEFGTQEELLALCQKCRLASCAAAAAGSAAGAAVEGGNAAGGGVGKARSRLAAAVTSVADLQELDRDRHSGFCLVVGSESRGVSPSLLQSCTRVALPMSELIESLNAGVAGGILMHALTCAWG